MLMLIHSNNHSSKE